jgi:hypothetical protein
VESRHILVNDLRKFGRIRAESHQAINGFDEGSRRGKKFHTDEIAFTIAGGRRLQVTHPRVGDRGLAIEHQAHRLHGLDGEWLMRFDQRAVMCEIVHPDGVAGVERPPERSEDFETDSRSSIAGRAHHRSLSMFARSCARPPPQDRNPFS